MHHRIAKHFDGIELLFNVRYGAEKARTALEPEETEGTDSESGETEESSLNVGGIN